mgnify:CR=1 FL=1
MGSTAIVWLRSDLRVHDHPALFAAAQEHARVVPLFVEDDRLMGARRGPRAAFLRGCLDELDGALRERGAALVVRSGRPEDVVPVLAAEVGAAEVLWTSDVSPFARARDRAVTAALQAIGIAPAPHPGRYCADVSQPRTKAGRPLTVFTPFWRAQRELPRRAVFEAPAALRLPDGLDPGALPAGPSLEDELPEPFCRPGETAARAAMAAWIDGPVDAYADRHDDLTGGTSGLSPYLRFGCISPRELEERALDRGGDGAAAFVRQLAWRDFYAHVLLLHPDNARLEFQPRYRDLAWDDDDELLAAWTAGRTGYPLVDAGMRQLAATGWMHNRARMVVGSFLTKDLHLDWRAGEAWFGRMLLDGEPPQNNGNWQWVASTGVDPAPYFRRIFNPVLQQEKFDPGGVYVRRWVPELRDVPAARLTRPWTMSEVEQREAGCVIGRDYPGPIVDHAAERLVTMDRYRAVAASAGAAG